MKVREQTPTGKIVKPQASGSPKRIFIVEDHPVFREGLKQLVNRESDLTVGGEAADCDQALKGIPRLNPDLVLVDLTLPGKSGLELIRALRAVNRQIKVLVVSMHDEALYADRVLRAGGDGYIMKQEDPEEIIHAIRDVLGGHIYVSEEVLANTPKAARKFTPKVKDRAIDALTDPELEILEMLGRGNSNQEIAHKSGFSVQAVASHCTQIRRKLNLRSAHALIRHAVCWVETDAS